MSVNWRQHLYHASLWLISLIFFFPVLWIILASFKTRDDLFAVPSKFIFTPTLQNYQDLFSRPNIPAYFFNSVFMSLTAVVIAVAVAFLAAYSFSRFKPRGTDFIMFLLLSIRMLPAAAAIVPIYLMYTALGWGGSHTGMILFYAMFSIPFSVWILKGFMDGVSQRFDETGIANGASRIHIIFRLIMPQVMPGIIAAFVFNLIFVWNEFLFNYLVGGRSTISIPVALSTGLYDTGGVNWGFISSLTTLYIVPPIIAIYFFQKYLLTGMTFGTVRGEV